MFSERVQSRRDAREMSRAKVLDNAEALFVRHGYGPTTVRQIADAASVSVGTVMSVADKEGLLVQVVDRRIAALHDAAAGESGGPGGVASPGAPGDAAERSDAADPAAAIVRLLGGFVHVYAAEPDLARAYTAVLVGGRHTSAVFTSLGDTLVDQVTQIATRAGFEPGWARATARVIHRAYLGELFMWAGRGDADPARTMAELDQTVRHLLAVGVR